MICITMNTKYSIRMAAQLSGLSPLTIRTWENRYQIVHPERSEGNHRLYSDTDVQRLKVLSESVQKGYKIGNLVKLTNEEINSLFLIKNQNMSEQNFIEKCDKAISTLDAHTLEEEFEEASIEIGIIESLDQLILPYMVSIGESWNKGEKQIFHEHLASEVVKRFISGKMGRYQNSPENPTALISTPSGQVHDIGASASALTAAISGFHTIYLGPDTPAEELVKACRTHSIGVLILSIHFPGNPGRVRSDLEYIRLHLPASCFLVVGGSSASAFIGKREEQEENSLESLKNRLLEIRIELTKRVH